MGVRRLSILRPTNIVNRVMNNICNLSKIKFFLQGGESAHIIHSDDVAAAALYFVENSSTNNPDCFIVSCYHSRLNTFGGCSAFCDAIKKNLPLNDVSPKIHLPWQLPYMLRRIGFAGALRDICDKN